MIGTLGDDEETTPSACRLALDAVARLESVREELSDAGNGEALEALRRAISELHPVRDECPSGDQDDLSIVAAVVRSFAEMSVAENITVGGAPGACSIATLGAPVQVAPTTPDARRVWIDGVCRPAFWTSHPRCSGRLVVSEESALDAPLSGESAYVEVAFGGTHAVSFVGYVVMHERGRWRVAQELDLGQVCL